MPCLRRVNMMAAVVVLCSLVDVCMSDECKRRDFGHGSVVCVCDAGHCDILPPLALPPPGLALLITSTKAGLRWKASTAKFRVPKKRASSWTLESEADVEDVEVEVEVDRGAIYQQILGFGGAFTDAAGLNILSLPQQLQDDVLRAYYSIEGLEYNFGRVPIGGTDFSTRPYTYDDLSEGEVDPALRHFDLAEEDVKYKIPLIQRAIELAHPTPLKLFGSAWGAPGWMKNNGKISGKGKIKPNYLSTWADYHVRFLEKYRQHNLSFWGLTTQNEPTDGLTEGFQFNAVGWTAEDQAAWLGGHLGPTLHAAGHTNLKLMILDDNRFFLPAWVDKVMSDSVAAQYVSGVAVHWYTDWITPTQTLDLTHSRHPSLFMMYTEACTGQWPWQPLKVVLGSWVRAEEYAADIIEALQHWATGWTDWNLALDLKGGPNWVNNFVDSPIIINAPKGEFYKQPMYYALAHFTKFLPEGSLRIGLPTIQRKGAEGRRSKDEGIEWEKERTEHTIKSRTEENEERKGERLKNVHRRGDAEEKLTENDKKRTEGKMGYEVAYSKHQHRAYKGSDKTSGEKTREKMENEKTDSMNTHETTGERKKTREDSDYYGLSHVAFIRPDNSTVAIFLNKGHDGVNVRVKERGMGRFTLRLEPHTITTVAWRP